MILGRRSQEVEKKEIERREGKKRRRKERKGEQDELGCMGVEALGRQLGQGGS